MKYIITSTIAILLLAFNMSIAKASEPNTTVPESLWCLSMDYLNEFVQLAVSENEEGLLYMIEKGQCAFMRDAFKGVVLESVNDRVIKIALYAEGNRFEMYGPSEGFNRK